MLTEKELQEIRDFMKKAENPLIMFDDDPDGLCSYLQLKPFLNNSKGVVIKSSPKLDIAYLRKIQEYHPDYTFVLDKPIISQEFIDQAKTNIIWIDHHPSLERSRVHYYNPIVKDKSDNPPVSYICYNLTKSNFWIALVGSIADWYIPKEFEAYFKEHKELFNNKTEVEDILYESDFGKLIHVFSFILKGKTEDVNASINALEKVKDPYEILNKTSPQGAYLYKRYEKTNRKYEYLLERALDKKEEGNLFVFIYPSEEMSFTSDLSNELMHLFPDKVILIGREKRGEVKMSIRSKKIKLPKIIEKSLEGVEGYGGGHTYACGGNVKHRDFHKFIENLKKQIN